MEQWQPQTLLSIVILLPQQQGQCREELPSSCKLQGWEDEQIPPADLQHCHQPFNILPLSLLLASWVVLQPCICCFLLCPSLLWLPAWLQSASHCHSHRMVPLSWSCTETVQGCNKPEGLRISAKTVGISNNTMQLTSNLLHSVFTQFHHSAANSKELKSSTGWKGTDAPLNPVLLWVIEHSQHHLPDFFIHFILQDSFLKRFNVTLL